MEDILHHTIMMLQLINKDLQLKNFINLDSWQPNMQIGKFHNLQNQFL